MSRILFIIAFIATSILLNAQSYSVKGIIHDKDKLSVIGAVAVVLHPVDSTMVGFSTTDNNGVFKIENLKSGDYLLQLTYIGYGTIQRKISLKPDNQLLDLGIITMMEEGEYLKTVDISAEYIPIKVTKDTLEYNADAFKTQPNAVVEDLLKRLPGVEVESDGSIKVKGEDVKAVTVNGKDFFGGDPKMATKNLPASAVKKVQVFEKKSKTSEFTGINDGNDEMTINLELKKNIQNGLFGNVMGGYGTDDRYESKAMINSFGSETQLSVLGAANNINNTGIDVSDYAAMQGSSGGRGMGMGRFNSSGLPLSFGQSNTGESKAITAGLNLNQNLSSKNRLTFSYYLTQSKTDLKQSTLTNSFLPSGTLISNNAYNSVGKNINHFFNTNIELKLDSTTEATIKGGLNIQNGYSNLGQLDTTFNFSRLLVNLNDQLKNNDNDGNNYNLSLSLRKKLNKPGRTVSLDGALGASEKENFNRLLSKVYGSNLIFNDSLSVFQDQNQNSGNSNYSFGLNYTEPLSDNVFLIANASRKNNKADQIKEFLDLNPDDLDAPGILNDILSRTFDNSFIYNTGGINVRLNKTNYAATVGVDYQNSNLDGVPSIGEKVNRTFNNFLPKATLDLDKLHIRMNYSTSVREPSVDQLQPILDNTDPLRPYQGNPNLVPEYRHNLRIGYHFFDQFNFRGIFANVRMGYTKNKISTATVLDPVTFIQSQTPVNTKDEKTVNASLNFTTPVNAIGAKFRTGINSSLISGINFINGIANDIDRWSNGLNVIVENKSKKDWDGSVSGRWSFNNNIYKNNSAQNTNFLNQTYNASLIWYAGKGWTVDTNMDYYIYAGGSFGGTTDVKLWQASVAKSFMNNKLTAKLRAFDILNQNQGVNRIVSETQIAESISNTIGRYLMLNLTYSLNSMI
ncbi:MAG: TonB-dependent receptor [Saprospiraceae bacterium]|nr:TonB-dependent receptor [Saprospiraceae bacterium]